MKKEDSKLINILKHETLNFKIHWDLIDTPSEYGYYCKKKITENKSIDFFLYVDFQTYRESSLSVYFVKNNIKTLIDRFKLKDNESMHDLINMCMDFNDQPF